MKKWYLDRRTKALATGGLLMPLAILVNLSIECRAGERPNLVFIMADDMGYGDAGCFGGTHISTPNIDRLAAEGMLFTQCYAGSPVCAPSRCTLMTGLHTGHCTVRGNFGQGGVVGLAGKPGRVPLKDEDVTVAEVLKAAGYVTGITGKWGLGEPGTVGVPLQQGFDHWFGYLNQRRAHSYYPSYLWLGNHEFDLPGNLGGRRQQYSHDLFTGFALNYIRTNANQPFFLYLPYAVPHNHFEVPDLGTYENKPWPTQAKTYAAMITRMDRDIGHILDLLEKLGIANDTAIFFCSDNGAADRYEGLFDSSGALRGRKRDLYEGGIRVPMIVRWPSKVAGGTKSELACYFPDMLPTFADLAGAPFSQPTDGVSILPTLLGKFQDLSDRFLYWEFFERGFQQAARWGRWKCLRLRETAPLELYDLDEDISETTNVAGEHRDKVRRFEAYLVDARIESTSFPKKKIRSP